MEQTPTLAQLLKLAIDNRLLDVHTALIGRIENYDAAMQSADIQPVLKSAIKTTDGFVQEDLPLLVDVPIIFSRAGGFFLSLPIQPGDYVQVIFNESSIDEFLTESKPTIESASRFTLQGAVAFREFFLNPRPLRALIKAILWQAKMTGCKSMSMARKFVWAQIKPMKRSRLQAK